MLRALSLSSAPPQPGPRAEDELLPLARAAIEGDAVALRTLLTTLGPIILRVVRRVIGGSHPGRGYGGRFVVYWSAKARARLCSGMARTVEGQICAAGRRRAQRVPFHENRGFCLATPYPNCTAPKE